MFSTVPFTVGHSTRLSHRQDYFWSILGYTGFQSWVAGGISHPPTPRRDPGGLLDVGQHGVGGPHPSLA